MRLIIAEKYYIGKKLAKDNLLNKDDLIVYTLGIGLWRESLETLTFKDIPFTGPPSGMRSFSHSLSHKIKNNFTHTLLHHSDLTPALKADAGEVSDENLDALVSMLRQALPHCTEIVLAVDHDRRGTHGAGQLLERLDDGNLPTVKVMIFDATTEESLKDAWQKRGRYDWQSSGFQKRHEEQKVKRCFEHWWHSNAALVFGELCKHAGLKGDPVVSKYELMLMCIAAQQQDPLSEVQLLDIMQQWRGTGRYAKTFTCQGIGQIGSPGTQAEIVNRLFERGFLNKNRDGVFVTTRGQLFMGLLHQKSFDPDLPFRLELWMTKGDIEGMKRYVRTFFGRQLRHQRKHKAV